MDRKSQVIAILLVVIIGMSGGLIYFATMAGTTNPTEKVNFTVGTTLAIGRVIHPQYVQGGDDPIVNQIFEGLFGYVGTTLELEPVLATDMGTVSEDGLEYTFTLRQGISFHDGTPFNASCVKDHFDRMFEINRGMTYIFTAALLNKTEVIDTYTVKFTLNYANSDFKGMLAHISAMIPSSSASEKYGEDVVDHPIGTGPFKFVSKIIDNEVVMEANQNWWKLQPGERIKIDELVFVQLSDASTMKLAIEQGDIDATDGRFNLVDYDSLLANTNLVPHDMSAASSSRWLTFEMNGTYWDIFPNKTLRQAFAYAIPYQQIIDVVLNGKGERLYSFLPPEYIGYKQASTYNYNATKALELIASAGLTAPIAVDLWITPTQYGVTEADVAALIAEYAADAGFTITIHEAEYAAFKNAFKYTSTQETMLWAWTADYPSTDNWATPFMSSGGFGTHYSEILQGDMASLYPYVDNLVQEAAGTTNDTRKVEILYELQDLWNEWVPNIFLWREMQYQFTQSYVTGAVYGVLRYDVHFEDVAITS
jgi:peptide/nickel transport system substrate-binding protein